jgi:hypothetical protein
MTRGAVRRMDDKAKLTLRKSAPRQDKSFESTAGDTCQPQGIACRWTLNYADDGAERTDIALPSCRQNSAPPRQGVRWAPGICRMEENLDVARAR